MNAELLYENAKNVLSYDGDTGLFTWKVKHCRKVKVGGAAGTANPNGYVKIKCQGHIFSAHRLAWYFCHGVVAAEYIDHINGDCGDNRISNLREATPMQSAANRAAHSDKRASRFKGVYAHAGRKKPWRVYIWRAGKYKYVGSYPTEELASVAYQDAAERTHGAFCEHVSRQASPDAFRV